MSQSLRRGEGCRKSHEGIFGIGGVLFRPSAEITIIPVGDAAAGSRGKTRFFPDLFRVSDGAG